ncbi:MAG: 30S ribosomal protein S6--L-glutamate ligase [Acidimicrobiia bacterium]|nr:30S ribosomal protein S6--L-glutamate ligase [Acidimicrobiia bacterium]MDH4309090.1 30S ribosomal protein S6--L-glutamate ligase [Acidimicrobiia bacterium]
MNIGILSRNSSLYSTRRLREAAEERGHNVGIVDYLRCYMNITSAKPKVLFRGDELGFDAVIPRIGASHTFYGSAVVRQFETMGVYAVNESQAIDRSRDKLRSLQLLASHGVGMPVTSYAHSTQDIAGLLEIVGGTPVVVKLLEGTQGLGVVLAETRKAAESVITAFRQLDANILVQEFIKESKGADVRAFVIGGRVVAAMRRQGAPGEFRSNLHRGGSAEQIKLTRSERATAIKAARVMGLNVAGVDLLQSERGPLVLEVNSSPGLEGIEAASGIDVAGRIIEFIEDNTDPEAHR